MANRYSQRAQAARELAAQLLFNMEEQNGRFSLFRDIDMPGAIRRENLTLEEVEELLETWKMRGFHGG